MLSRNTPKWNYPYISFNLLCISIFSAAADLTRQIGAVDGLEYFLRFLILASPSLLFLVLPRLWLLPREANFSLPKLPELGGRDLDPYVTAFSLLLERTPPTVPGLLSMVGLYFGGRRRADRLRLFGALNLCTVRGFPLSCRFDWRLSSVPFLTGAVPGRVCAFGNPSVKVTSLCSLCKPCEVPGLSAGINLFWSTKSRDNDGLVSGLLLPGFDRIPSDIDIIESSSKAYAAIGRSSDARLLPVLPLSLRRFKLVLFLRNFFFFFFFFLARFTGENDLAGDVFGR